MRLGLRENLGQFSLLLLINALVGATVGMERSFGVVKAFANGFAGVMADRWGRRRILLAGWIAALPG